MSLINVSNLTFAYEGSYDTIFENVSFQMDTDWKLGFTGRNGRGKTTFLHLLMGRYEYGGTISASVAFEYFPYDVKDKNVITKGLIDEICPSYPEWRLSRELSLLEVGDDVLNRPFSTLSNGERTKVLLAALFLRENNFLLIDEPTNHLDRLGRETVSRYLDTKKGYILVSHDRAFLDGCVDHVLSINKANIEIQRGNFSSWMANKKLQDAFELAENAKLKKDIKRLEAAARQSTQWADKVESTKMGKGAAKLRKKGHVSKDTMAYNAEKSRRMQQRRKNLERRQESAIEEKSSLLKNLDHADKLKITQLPYHTDRLLSLFGVSIFYGDAASPMGKRVCRDVSFSVEAGDRIALCGRNGSGKTSLLKLICGGEATRDGSPGLSYTGEFMRGSRLKISYVPQDTSSLCGDLSDYAREHGIDESLFKAILRKLDFSRIQFEKDMRDFSGGQKKKTLLAKSLCEKAHLLVWDEPLNFVDVLSRMQIEELLMEYRPTLLFVEHDGVFCDKVATKRINLLP
ncbi:MAG: ABC-F type ribosomal protection protein [Defluviitaleaceae bacterium]|nr:ABC-F type ribosomal protection protein [Defluviitaleaceae bacterium]